MAVVDSLEVISYLLGMDDRKLGYLVLSILLLFFGGVLVYLAPSWTSAGEIRTILFHGVRGQGFLSPQDPVSIRGVEVGKVTAVLASGENAHVVIETRQPIQIHKGYRVKVALRGIMGETLLAIEPGDKSAPLIDKKDVLQGTVDMTPPEALAFVDTLQTVIRSLARLTSDLRNGTGDRRSLITVFLNVMCDIDSLSTSLVRVSGDLDQQMTSGIDTLAAALRETAEFARELETSIPLLVETLVSLVSKTERLVEQVQSLITKSEELVAKVNDPKSLLWSNKLQQLHEQIKLLRETIEEIEIDGIRLPVRATTM